MDNNHPRQQNLPELAKRFISVLSVDGAFTLIGALPATIIAEKGTGIITL
ncbi:MAG: hypothetical protein V1698_02855 [bacterium]